MGVVEKNRIYVLQSHKAIQGIVSKIRSLDLSLNVKHCLLLYMKLLRNHKDTVIIKGDPWFYISKKIIHNENSTDEFYISSSV